ncbi:hypothetical protein MRX96_040247 [Rhipicephalus microplus]
MRKDVQYRDLPGGPLMIKFADELPLCTLCSRCGMLSKDMFEDPSSHAFCSVCIFECSDRKKIHCKYENKDVSVDEMMPAIDILNIVMDQVVYCPNTREGDSCREHCSLKDLEGHLLKCEKTEVICLSCGDSVKGVDWQDHVTSCPQHVVQCRPLRCGSPSWEAGASRACVQLQSKRYPGRGLMPNRNEHRLTPEPRDKARANTEAVRRSTPSAVNNVGGVVIESCPLCKRNVKSTNMAKHYSICQQRMPSLDHDEANQTPGTSVQPPMRETVPTKEPIRKYTGNLHEGYSTPESRKSVIAPQDIIQVNMQGPLKKLVGSRCQCRSTRIFILKHAIRLPWLRRSMFNLNMKCLFTPFRAVAAIAPMPPVAPGRRPDHHAPINQGFHGQCTSRYGLSTPGACCPSIHRESLWTRRTDSIINYMRRTDKIVLLQALLMTEHTPSNELLVLPPSSMVYCPQLQQHRRVDEVATSASEDYDLLSDLEDLSISGGPNEHGQHVAPQQGGGYDQPAASSSTETQSSQPQQAQVCHGVRDETHSLTDSAEQNERNGGKWDVIHRFDLVFLGITESNM